MQVYEAPLRDMRFVIHELHQDDGFGEIEALSEFTPDLVDAVRGLDVRKVGFVDLLEIGFVELAAARQRLVDDLVERRVVSGRVDVPDLIIAGNGGLAKRADLAKRDFSEGQRTFVLVQQLDHCYVPNARNVGCVRQQ